MLHIAKTFVGLLCAIGFAVHAALPPSDGYLAVNGGNLYYIKYGNAANQPMIVLHGGPGLDSSYLLPQMSVLGKNNETVFYDQRGSGKSLGFAINDQTINIDTFVADLEAVRKHFGYKKFSLVGHSWGGLLAMFYAIKYPQNLSVLVLVDSAPANSTGFDLFMAEYTKRLTPIQSEITQIENSLPFKNGDPKTVTEYYRKIFALYFYDVRLLNQLTLRFTKESALNGFAIGQIFQNTLLKDYDLTAKLHALQLPVTIVHGDNDIVPLETAKQIKDAIQSAKLVVIKECDHFPYIEKPREFFAVFK